jgi:hypothetical protein
MRVEGLGGAGCWVLGGESITAEVAKDLRKDRKGLYIKVLTLRTLLQLSVLCGLKDFLDFPI